MQEIICYNSCGQEVKIDDPDVCAKSVWHEHTGRTVHFVKTKNGLLFNPEDNLDKRRVVHHRFKFEKIDEEGFKLYLRFLGAGDADMKENKSARRSTLFAHAQRRLS